MNTNRKSKGYEQGSHKQKIILPFKVMKIFNCISSKGI